jgi:7 transmembrane sweet-taste receptor of 3 GCPR
MLFGVVGVLMLIDIIYLAIWTGVDKWRAVASYDTLQDDDEYMIICESEDANSVWLGVLIGYKALFIIVGCVLSFLTRNITSAFAESRAIALIMYQVGFSAVILIPLVFLLDFSPDANYIVRHLGLIVTVFIALSLLYVPKIFIIASSAPGSSQNDSQWLSSQVRKSLGHGAGSTTSGTTQSGTQSGPTSSSSMH